MLDMINFYSAWVDGVGFKIGLEEAKVPEITDQGEAFRGGGMLAELDVPLGLEKFAASIMMASIDPPLMKQAGLKAGKFNRITLRGNLADQFSDDEKEVIAIVEGRLSAAPKAWKAGAKSGVEYPISTIKYYKLIIGDELIYEIDILNMVQFVSGEDQLKTARGNTGF